MESSRIKRICVTIINITMVCLAFWYLWSLRMKQIDIIESVIITLQDSRDHMEFQAETIDYMFNIINIQTETIIELEEEVNELGETLSKLSDDLTNHQAMLIESEAERERVERENQELKKNIADLHARNAQSNSANIRASITENDKILLAQLVYSEARGESQKGQQAVVDVVLNRLADSRFPDTIRGVIMQANQFDEAHILHTYPATDTILNVVNTALSSVDVTNGALFFFNPSTAGCSWQWSRTLTAQIGPHRFSR